MNDPRRSRKTPKNNRASLSTGSVIKVGKIASGEPLIEKLAKIGKGSSATAVEDVLENIKKKPRNTRSPHEALTPPPLDKESPGRVTGKEHCVRSVA